MEEKELKKVLLSAQKNEITEHYIYKKLASAIKEPKNKQVFFDIAKDELKHYNFWKKFTQKEIGPNKYNFRKYFLISKIFGLTFGIKLMENGEKKAQVNYDEIIKSLPEAQFVKDEEEKHENELIKMINEEKLKYIGSVVLGLNDALVELSGALAGFTLAFQNTRLIAMAGLITGIAASFSMAASEYLSTKTEEGQKNPFKASIYTGLTYILTVFFLILPYLLLKNHYLSLAATIIIAIILIFFFNFYISVAKDISFKKRFWEMALISLGIAALSFGIGYFIKILLNVEVG